MSYKAYLHRNPGASSWDKQMFFLGYAQIWCGVQRPKAAQAHVLKGVHSPKRYRVIDVDDRAMRVRNFHQNTLNALAELMESAGLEHPSQLNRQHIMRRHSGSQVQMEEKFSPTVRNKSLLSEGACGDERIDAYWRRVSGECFGLTPEAVEA